jgi:glycosyltransferase involved in cell wall biosynthesis
MPTPLLIISDAPTSGTGLGRITSDLAKRIALHLPEFRVATLGYGGSYSRALPFPQYTTEMKDWVIYNLPEVWHDHAGDEKGAILTIWDASRMLWFSRPENCGDSRLRKFLEEGDFAKWGYFPMDATGPHHKLTAYLKHVIEGYDRVLAYSKWAEDILRRTLIRPDLLSGLTNLPHGIDASVFYPRPRVQARHSFGYRINARDTKGKAVNVGDDSFLIGIVATNQARKDYGLGIQVAAELKKSRKINLWIHLDELERHWSIPALLNDFGLLKEAIVTCVPFTDDQMAWCYSACDVTLGIGNGEGFGYPIFESLACETPCIHGDYGGAAEHMSPEMLVPHPEGPVELQFRLEGIYNCVRPVHNPLDWEHAVRMTIGHREPVTLPPDLDWINLWPRWAEWFKAGLPCE